MNILMISDFYPPFWGGVEVLVSTLSKALTRRGHSVTVATLAAPKLPSVAEDDGVTVHRLRSMTQRLSALFTDQSRPWAPPVPDPGVVLALRLLLASQHFDVVHGHDWLARSYFPFARRETAPLVMSLHYFTLSCPKKSLTFNDSPCSGPALVKCLGCAGDHYGRVKGSAVVAGQRIFSRAEAALVDLFVPVSESTAVENGLQAAGRQYVVVPNLVPDEEESGVDPGLLAELPAEPFLLFVGDMRREKGMHVLLAAYRQLHEPPPLVIIAKIWDAGFGLLPPGVHVVRNWPNPAVRAAMGRCSALVVPSVWEEPFGIVVAEALSAGRPVVASRIGGIPEIVRHEQEGLLVEPNDVVGLTQALNRLREDPQLRESMAVRARQRAKLYAADSVVPLFEAAYARAGELKAARRQRPAA